MLDDIWPFVAVSVGLLLAGGFGIVRLWTPAAAVLGLSSGIWVGIAGLVAFREAIRGYSPSTSDFPIYSVGAIGVGGVMCAFCVLFVARHRGAWLITGWLITVVPIVALGAVVWLLRHDSNGLF